jgi:hypothetical protein
MVIIMADETFIDLPNSPQQIGVLLTPANLRNIDFSSLDFDTARRAILEYIRTYFPNDFNDFVASNGIVMLTEIIASTVAKLSLRSDLLSNESTLPTCKTENALINHLALINQAIKVQTAASTSFEVAFIGSPLAIDISIPPGLILTTNGPDNKPVSYEVFKSPADNISNIVIPAGKLGVIAYGVEGTTVINDSIVTTGGANQIYTIVDSNVLIHPLKVILKSGNIEDYYRPTTDSVESYGPNDKVVEVRFYSDKIMLIVGDNIHGVAPGAGANISFTYRKGGGIRGRIGAGVIDATRSIFDDVSRVSTTIRFRNIVPSSGGSDRETIIEAKKRAPREYAVRNNLVTAEDYAQACLSFAHPTYGSIKKAVSALFSNINANQVRLYVLAEGYSSKPVTASLGLKLALKTYLEENNVLTDQVLIADGSVKLVDVEINVIVSRGADASTVKEKVESAITDFFDISKWDMGQPLFTSNMVKQLESIEGIAYIDLFKPANNILPNQQIIFSDATGDIDGIGINQLIAEGNRVTTYFYEKLSSTQSVT